MTGYDGSIDSDDDIKMTITSVIESLKRLHINVTQIKLYANTTNSCVVFTLLSSFHGTEFVHHFM